MKKSFIKLISIFGLVCSLGFLGEGVFASGIKVYPSQIKLEIEKGDVMLQKIFVENNSKERLAFEVKTEKAEKWVVIKQASFILEQGGKKEIEISITPNEKGALSNNVLVLAKQTTNSNGLKTSIGVKIPIEILVKQNFADKLSGNIMSFFDREIKIKYLVWAFVLMLTFFFVIWLAKTKLLQKKR